MLTALALICAAALACGRTARSQFPTQAVSAADLECERDDDCTIRGWSLRCCEVCPVEPYAISRKVSAAVDAACEGEPCLKMDCEIPGIPQPDAFRAVCTHRRCERIPASR